MWKFIFFKPVSCQNKGFFFLFRLSWVGKVCSSVMSVLTSVSLFEEICPSFLSGQKVISPMGLQTKKNATGERL